MRKLIVASTSTIHGSRFLEYLLPHLEKHFKSVTNLLFIPYARPGGISHSTYTGIVSDALSSLPFTVQGIHEFDDPIKAIKDAEAIYVGGGNTFVLMDQLISSGLIEVLKNKVKAGTPYLGTSAGSNIVGPNVKTTNDMPIVHPETLDALDLVPFNINPHYLDPDPDSKHKGETRETRIKEFHAYNDINVIGLREGSWIEVNGSAYVLKGPMTARIFKKNTDPFEISPETDLNEIL
ncbi:dipeptidase PepE [Lutimonas halocynthiae]|uniref:dipeptidase PepE n=1 Tax=Lutimonas halocynthiae TaxID=1446477 RepID=UPI0025B28169|nr:dipeptidase PepE [Lutimonas halocynthiae]MDN3643419.1 dipeptidase PepE [Lutimonas halocynthiae]